MYILIKNQEGESMNLLSQNTDFNALRNLKAKCPVYSLKA